jgi:hypothetical protein
LPLFIKHPQPPTLREAIFAETRKNRKKLRDMPGGDAPFGLDDASRRVRDKEYFTFSRSRGIA